MEIHNAQIDLVVVRSKGDYVVGRTGRIVDIDRDKRRVRVAWEGFNKTWVHAGVVEPIMNPYKIETGPEPNCYPVYIKLKA